MHVNQHFLILSPRRPASAQAYVSAGPSFIREIQQLAESAVSRCQSLRTKDTSQQPLRRATEPRGPRLAEFQKFVLVLGFGKYYKKHSNVF